MHLTLYYVEIVMDYLHVDFDISGHLTIWTRFLDEILFVEQENHNRESVQLY